GTAPLLAPAPCIIRVAAGIARPPRRELRFVPGQLLGVDVEHAAIAAAFAAVEREGFFRRGRRKVWRLGWRAHGGSTHSGSDCSGCGQRSRLALLPRRVSPLPEGVFSAPRACWQSTHRRTPGTALRRASGIGVSHSSQLLRPGPRESWLRTRSIASLTVASIWSWTAPSPAQPVAMSDSWVADVMHHTISRRR